MFIRWYGIMYVVSFWLAWLVVPFLGKKRGVVLSRDAWTTIIAYGALGVLIGGRLGYAVLYEPMYFFQYPLELFKIWHGGMSSHGGFIGAAVGVWIAVRKTPVSLLAVADILCIPAAIGLALGRIGNITNGEFGMYPYYEALANVVIAGVCYFVLRRHHPTQPPLEKGRSSAFSPPYQGGVGGGESGVVIAIFLILYSISRFLLEFLRPDEWGLIVGLSRGQIYTIPMLIIGVLLFGHAIKPESEKGR